jgi:hypothetical protein
MKSQTTQKTMKRNIYKILFVCLAIYSVSLIAVEVCTSQDYVRHYFSDITGPVPFFAINTTLSVFLLWGTALLFGVCIAATPATPAFRSRRLFFLSQVAVFAYLGFDDRFMFHETIGKWFDVADHYILGLVATAQAVLVATLARENIPQKAWHRLGAAVGLFFVMLFFDAIVPHDMLLRLTVEDVAKTWACVFFFLYAWETLMSCLKQLQTDDSPRELQVASVATQRSETNQPMTAV